MARKFNIVTVEKPVDLSGIVRAYAEKMAKEKAQEATQCPHD